MPQACRIFLKSTLTLALTAIFCQVATAQQNVNEDEKSISLVKKTPVKSEQTTKNINATPEQEIAVLQAFPGVYATTLLPNGRFSQISLGGSLPFGTDSVAIVEDGINHAPLPYLDNSLINLSMASVESLEVLLSPQAEFGPNGMGGAINITRDQIPSDVSGGELELGYGSDKQALIDLGFGGQKGNWGSLFSFNRQQGDSYRVNRNGQSGDYSANDFIIRIKEIAPPLNSNRQQTELKIQFKDYQNDESRFGISREDFATNPMLRYMATAQDNESQEQLNIHLKHLARLDNQELLTTDLYYNDGEAGFFQTVGVNGLSGDSAARALGLFEQTPVGSVDIVKQGLDRSYSSWGVQFKVAQQIERHDISLGVRYHTESLIDRLHSDVLSLDNQFVLSGFDDDTEVAIYKDTARIRSIFLTDRWQNGQWDVKLGVRHEEINLRREGTNIVGDELGETKQSITLASAAASYSIDDYWSVFLSGHQGYQPERSSVKKVEAQESDVVRGGVVYTTGNSKASVIAFTNNYDNLLGSCRLGPTCTTGQSNFGEARVEGVEISIDSQWQMGTYLLPVRLAYTHNDGEYRSNYDTDFGLQVNDGDLLPFVPRNHLYLNAGIEASHWQASAEVSYRDKQRTTPGVGNSNAAQIIDDVTLVSINASYQLGSKQSIYLVVNNATDESYVESSFQAGVLAGNERTVFVGYKMTF